MKLSTRVLCGALCAGAIASYSLVNAEEHRGGGGERGPGPARAAPPRFVAHAPGAHPTVRRAPHPARVLAPRVMVYGRHDANWHHWSHPEFARPAYYWDWGSIHTVSCVAEDSYGDQYPVTENTTPGWGLNNMTSVEDDALDRCYQESGNDPNCYLATCSHF